MAQYQDRHRPANRANIPRATWERAAEMAREDSRSTSSWITRLIDAAWAEREKRQKEGEKRH